MWVSLRHKGVFAAPKRRSKKLGRLSHIQGVAKLLGRAAVVFLWIARPISLHVRSFPT